MSNIHGNIKHNHCGKAGSRRTPTYNSWIGMKQRCLNPKSTSFKNYGGRGITMCDRWLKFENFLSDMGERPADKTLDRKEVNKNYELSNCKWSTKTEQNAHKRKRARIEQFTTTELIEELIKRGRGEGLTPPLVISLNVFN